MYCPSRYSTRQVHVFIEYETFRFSVLDENCGINKKSPCATLRNSTDEIQLDVDALSNARVLDSCYDPWTLKRDRENVSFNAELKFRFCEGLRDKNWPKSPYKVELLNALIWVAVLKFTVTYVHITKYSQKTHFRGFTMEGLLRITY